MKSDRPKTRMCDLLRKRPIGNYAGFTVIEMVVVVFIAGIIMATAVLGIQNIVKRHTAEELISELHIAQMMAIQRHLTVTVAFNPNTPQAALSWSDNGVLNQVNINLGTKGEGYVFDSTPPGTPAPPTPDVAFIFSPLGFISTNPGGDVAGNIYLTNLRNSRSFQIQTTISGGINLNRHDPLTDTWISAH